MLIICVDFLVLFHLLTNYCHLSGSVDNYLY